MILFHNSVPYNLLLAGIVCVSLCSPHAVSGADSERSAETKKKKPHRYTKLLRTYDPGLEFAGYARKDKDVEKVAKPGWNDKLELPISSYSQPPRPQRLRQPEQEEDDDTDDWLLHITDPDSHNNASEKADSEADSWESDILSHPRNFLTRDRVKDAINQMAKPQYSSQIDHFERTDKIVHEEEEEQREKVDADHALYKYEPTLSGSSLNSDLTGGSEADKASMSVEELAPLQSYDTYSAPDEEEETLLSGTWETLASTASREGIFMRSSSDGLLSQTRDQLSRMAGGYSIFRENNRTNIGLEPNRGPVETGDFESSTKLDFAPTDATYDSMFSEGNEFAFGDFSTESSPGAEQDDFGEKFADFGGEHVFQFDDGFSATTDLSSRASDGIDNPGSRVVEDIRNKGPKDLFDQSDPFGNQSDRFKFLGE